MVKNILLIVMTIVSLMFFGYAFIQKLEADKQFLISEKLTEEVEKQKSIAVMNEQLAIAAQKEAEKQHVLAVEALAACEKSKRK